MPFLLRRALLAILTLCLAIPATAGAAAGDLDPAFADEGLGLYDPDGGENFFTPTAAAIPLAGGKTLLVGSGYGADATVVTLLRLDADGKPDPAYGEAGVMQLPASAGSGVADAVALPDGDIVVLANGVRDGGTHLAYALSRVNPDGTLDKSFGTNGTSITGFEAFSAYDCPTGPESECYVTGEALELAGTDRLVVGARLVDQYNRLDTSTRATQRAGVARYDLAGKADSSFGDEAGTTVLAAPARYTSAGLVRDLSVEPEGEKRILVAEEVFGGSRYLERTAVHRLDEDGAPDTSFGAADDGDADDGIAVIRFRPTADETRLSEAPHAVQALPEGDVAVAGGSHVAAHTGPGEGHGVVARLSNGGELDEGFGEGGVALADRGYPGYREFSELELIEGVLYAAGIEQRYEAETDTYGASAAWLARLDDAGFDAAFGQSGSVVHGGMNDLSALFETANGFAILSGNRYVFDDSRWAAARVDLQDSRKPVNLGHPAVMTSSGGNPASKGDRLSAGNGSWRYGGTVGRQWQRCAAAQTGESPASDGECANVAGQTGETYTVGSADQGKHVRVVETNTNGSFTETAASGTVEILPEPPAFTSGPSVTPAGSVPAGSTVRATWTQSGTEPITARVRWLSCTTATTGCGPVSADDPADDAYVTSAGDAGSFLRAVVELDNGRGGFASKAAENSTGVTAPTNEEPPKATAAPTIAPTGSVQEGTTLTKASDGSWDQSGLTFTYRWERCDTACAAIAGAGGDSYTTTPADVGKRVRLVVDARKGDGPVGSAASEDTAVTAKPKPEPPKEEPKADPQPQQQQQQPQPEQPQPQGQPQPQQPKGTPPPPANPFGLTGPVVFEDTTVVKIMPDVRGLSIDAAKQRIESAGIFAKIDVRETIRKKPRKLKGEGRLDIGDVSAQSLAKGTKVTSGIGTPKTIRLVTEAGPRATKGNGGPFGDVCAGRAIRDDLKGLGLGEVFEILQMKRCTKFDVDYKVSSSAKEVEVRKARKDSDGLQLTVVVPGNPANMDLTPVFRQGAFNGNPTFGGDDWALTSDAKNIFGVQVINRAGTTVVGAEVLVDGSKVGADDERGTADGGIFVTGFEPRKAGTVNVLVSQEDAQGNRVFGFGHFPVRERNGAFTAIDGRRFTAQGDPAAATARAAGLGDIFAAIGGFFRGFGANFSAVNEQLLANQAKQNTGLVQLGLGDILSGAAKVVASGGANVVASGGANVVASGGANVVASGGANAVSVAKDKAVAIDEGKTVGTETIQNGTGALRPLPEEVGGKPIGGGNVIAPANAGVVASGGANAISTAAGKLISDNGLG